MASAFIDTPEENFRAIDVSGDGNCFFYSVLLSLQLTYPDLRINGRLITEFSNKTFMEYLQGIIDPEADALAIGSILETSCFAERETIEYIARKLGLNIIVHQIFPTPMRINFGNSRNPSIRVIHLDNHYNALVDKSLITPEIESSTTIRTIDELIEERNQMIEDGDEHRDLVARAKKLGKTDAEFMLNDELKEFLSLPENQPDTSDDEELARLLARFGEEPKTRLEELRDIAKGMGIENYEFMIEDELHEAINKVARTKYLKYKQKYLKLQNKLK
jgi:hypothetical protein